MNTIRTLLCALLLIATAAATAGGGNLPGVDPLIKGPLLLRLVDDPEVTIESFIEWFNGAYPKSPVTGVTDSVVSRRTYLLEMDLSQIPPEQQEVYIDGLETEWELQLPPQVRWIEPAYEGQAPEGKTGSTWVTLVGESAFDSQYSGGVLDIPGAQESSTGGGVVVAVLDTGIDGSHPQLQGRVLPGFNFVDGSTNTADGADGMDNDEDGISDEMAGHGTYVAGLINYTAPDAKLLPVVVLNDEGVSDLWTIGKGMYYAIDAGVEVINMSLGSTYKSEMLEDAEDEAAAAGIVVVAAAGNLDRAQPEEFPANNSNIFGVAALDHLDTKADFSNWGEDDDALFISAPGATLDAGDGGPAIVGPLPGGDYAIWEGTSFATAFVSGAAALIRSQHPEWPASPFTQFQIGSRLSQTAVNIDAANPAYAGLLGAGRMNIGAAVDLGPPAPALGDINADGVVGIGDLIDLIEAWGETHSSADLDGDGNVGVGDLILMIMSWG